MLALVSLVYIFHCPFCYFDKCCVFHDSDGGGQTIIITAERTDALWQLFKNLDRQREVALLASSKRQHPPSALLWISCQTLKSSSLKTNNQEGVKLSCHRSLLSLVSHFSSSSLSPPYKAYVPNNAMQYKQWNSCNHSVTRSARCRHCGDLAALSISGGGDD